MVRDGAVGSIGSSRRDQLLDDARKMATLDADQPAVAQLLLHEEVRQMAPRHAREDNLLLHLVIRDGAFVRAFDEEMAFAGRASHGVAQDGLREGAQPRRRERPGRDEHCCCAPIGEASPRRGRRCGMPIFGARSRSSRARRW